MVYNKESGAVKYEITDVVISLFSLLDAAVVVGYTTHITGRIKISYAVGTTHGLILGITCYINLYDKIDQFVSEYVDAISRFVGMSIFTLGGFFVSKYTNRGADNHLRKALIPALFGVFLPEMGTFFDKFYQYLILDMSMNREKLKRLIESLCGSGKFTQESCAQYNEYQGILAQRLKCFSELKSFCEDQRQASLKETKKNTKDTVVAEKPKDTQQEEVIDTRNLCEKFQALMDEINTKLQIEYLELVQDLMNKGRFYVVLGIERTASIKEIDKAYRKLALIFHVDNLSQNTSEKEKEAKNNIWMQLTEVKDALKQHADNNFVYSGVSKEDLRKESEEKFDSNNMARKDYKNKKITWEEYQHINHELYIAQQNYNKYDSQKRQKKIILEKLFREKVVEVPKDDSTREKWQQEEVELTKKSEISINAKNLLTIKKIEFWVQDKICKPNESCITADQIFEKDEFCFNGNECYTHEQLIYHFVHDLSGIADFEFNGEIN